MTTANMPPTDVPCLTLPTAATRLGLTLWELVGLLHKNPALNARVFKVGGRRTVMAVDIPLFRAALAERQATTA